jgi:uncharacterized OB-fold protein
MATGSFGNSRRGFFPTLLASTLADATTQPFWDAAKQDKLAVPRCKDCGTFRLPPLPICYECQSDASEWVELPGTGSVYTYMVVHHPLHPDLAEVCPYVSGVIELDGTQGEGARMLANIVDCDPQEISIGTRVEIVFEHVNAEMAVARFRPIRSQESRS